VIDEAGANVRLQPPSKRKKVIQRHDIENIVAKGRAHSAEEHIGLRQGRLRTLDRDLSWWCSGRTKLSVFWQRHQDVAHRSRQRTEADRFLPVRRTDRVGKTEVTRQLALIMGIELIRFDMSEYMERHTVSRLIGAPARYVGFDQGGLLTEAVIKHPHAVLLLDEVEEAHPDVLQPAPCR